MIAKDQSYIVTIKTVKFPNKYTNIIQKIVRKHGYDLDQAKRLAVNVLKLSDLYNSRKTQGNIWADSGALVAYLVYFFPLNYLRVQRALRLSSQIGYWRELRHWYEFGSGCGTAFLAYLDLALSPVDHAHFIETSPEANALMKNLLLAAHDIDLKNIQWSLHPPSQWVDNNNKYFIASYSLNEISELPKWVQQCENIFIVEPSLQKTTRHLMTLRQQLINHNYYVWAPCTHQESCPLLTHS
ncbi:MAG: hypothetical protein KDD40_07730 [Bdellovibrionales bacterium]|nr:hypothetical protein [Bdellovibrionales bacterium]